MCKAQKNNFTTFNRITSNFSLVQFVLDWEATITPLQKSLCIFSKSFYFETKYRAGGVYLSCKMLYVMYFMFLWSLGNCIPLDRTFLLECTSSKVKRELTLEDVSLNRRLGELPLAIQNNEEEEEEQKWLEHISPVTSVSYKDAVMTYISGYYECY